MKTIIALTVAAAGALGIAYLRAFPWLEKKNDAPEQTAGAKVISRRVTTGTHNRSGRTSGFGYSYLVTFRLEDGTYVELAAYDHEYGALREGDQGKLTWKGDRYVDFAKAA